MFETTMAMLRLVKSLALGNESNKATAKRQVRSHLAAADRGQSNLTGLIIGITIAAVVGVAVAIPVINDVVANSSATGTTLTVLDLLDLFIGLLILVAIAAPLMRRT